MSQIDLEQALVFLDAWGTGETLDEKSFQGHKYVISDYAPEWVQLPAEYADHGGVVTLLAVMMGESAKFKGYRVLDSFGIGERECPYRDQHREGEDCEVCEGDDYLYWGEEWSLVVLLPEGGRHD